MNIKYNKWSKTLKLHKPLLPAPTKKNQAYSQYLVKKLNYVLLEKHRRKEFCSKSSRKKKIKKIQNLCRYYVKKLLRRTIRNYYLRNNIAQNLKFLQFFNNFLPSFGRRKKKIKPNFSGTITNSKSELRSEIPTCKQNKKTKNLKKFCSHLND